MRGNYKVGEGGRGEGGEGRRKSRLGLSAPFPRECLQIGKFGKKTNFINHKFG